MGCNDPVASKATLNAVTNAYSSSTETGLVYTLRNNSSYTVTVWDNTGEIDLAPGKSTSARFNSKATVNDVSYVPADKVVCEQSGTTFTFSNR